ncbi:MAG: hypothetical protein ABSC37_07755 [Xanthobacteraceae bacterium]
MKLLVTFALGQKRPNRIAHYFDLVAIIERRMRIVIDGLIEFDGSGHDRGAGATIANGPAEFTTNIAKHGALAFLFD